MSYKDMVTKYVPASTNNYTSGRFDDIHGIVIHHAATTSLSAVDATFTNPSRQASAHFAVCGKEVHQYVDLNDTAWHCGDWPGNCCTVGIELVNSTITPDYRVSEETFNTAIKLVAKLAKDLGLGKIAFEPDGVYPTLSAHRDWSATYCPGDYVYSRMNEMAKKVNDINYPPYVPAVLEWKKLDKPTIYVTEKEPTSLRDFNHTHYENCKAVKSFSKGTEIVIYGKVYNKTIDKTFLLTEYSYTNKITNGFLSDDMAIKVEREEVKVEASIQESKTEEPKVESEPLKEVQEEAELTRGLTEEDYMAVIQKAQESLELIENEVKNTGFTIKMSSKVYDVLKFIAIVVLPAISALYIGLSNIWGFGFGEQVDATVQLVIAIINALLGLTVAKSNYDYKKNQ